MPSNRIVVLGGIWADGAEDPPETPVAETTYANSELAMATIEAAWPYSVKVDSANFNEFMRRISVLIGSIESWGILPWSALTAYTAGARAMGSDGVIYRCIDTTTNEDPTTTPTKWVDDGFAATTKMVFYQAAAPAGWVKDTTHNNKALRVVSGNGGGDGGTHDLSSPPSLAHLHTGPSHVHTTGDLTLTAAQSGLPAHAHNIPLYVISGLPYATVGGTSADAPTGVNAATAANGAANASQAHNHGNTGAGGTGNTGSTTPTAFAPKYIDVIVCTKS